VNDLLGREVNLIGCRQVADSGGDASVATAASAVQSEQPFSVTGRSGERACQIAAHCSTLLGEPKLPYKQHSGPSGLSSSHRSAIGKKIIENDLLAHSSEVS